MQMQAIPSIYSGRDVLAVAPTGSGKTAAFLVPIIGSVLKVPKKGGARALVLTPTRELATQIFREFQRLSAGKRFRGTVLSKAHNNGVGSSNFLGAIDFIVSTPMRLVHLVRRERIDLSSIKCLVLDEADRLFEEGQKASSTRLTKSLPRAAKQKMGWRGGPEQGRLRVQQRAPGSSSVPCSLLLCRRVSRR